MCKISPSFINQQLYKMTSILIRKSSLKKGLKCFMKVAFIRLIHLNITQGLLTAACWNLDCVEAKIFFNLCIDQNAGKNWGSKRKSLIRSFCYFFSMNGTNGTSKDATCKHVFLVFEVDKLVDIRKTKNTKLFHRNFHQRVVCFRISGFRLNCLWNLDWIGKKSFQSDRNGLET